MARGTGGASRGKTKGGRVPASRKRLVSYLRPSESPSSNRPQRLSLQEEARSTERSVNHWDSDKILRHMKVNFVSAIEVNPSAEQDTNELAMTSQKGQNDGAALPTISPSETTDLSTTSQALATPFTDTDRSRESLIDAIGHPHEAASDLPNSMASFFIDRVGSESTIATGLPQPIICMESTELSDSSAEIILFSGRGRNQRTKAEAKRYMRSTANVASEVTHIATGQVNSPAQQQSLSSKQSMSARSPADPRPVRIIDDPLLKKSMIDSVEEAAPLQGLSGTQSPKRRSTNSTRVILQSPQNIPNVDEGERLAEAAVIADYIANTQDGSGSDVDLIRGTFSARDLGPSVRDEYDDGQRDGWDSPALKDLDDISTSEEVLDAIQQILSKRHRAQGVQYLIVWEGYTVDDAKWIPNSSLTMSGAAELIQKFEEDEQQILTIGDESADSADTELYDESCDGVDDVDDAMEDEKDEADLIQRRVDRMTDEKIARLLAKQEELGMGSNRLMIFDDTDGQEDNEDFFRLHAPGKSSGKVSSATTKRRSSGKRFRGEAPSASDIADAYDGFDIMEWERPSLRSKPRGAKDRLPFMGSDSELDEALQASWTEDRKKKKARRQEREELRAQGLLGKKNKSKSSLRTKYFQGMTLVQMKEEIKDFLLSSNESLSLPPMDKRERKIVHEFANAFTLKSKSFGDSKNRFPILYKTGRNRVYDEEIIEALESKLQRRNLVPRFDRKVVRRAPGGVGARRAFGGSGNAAAGYRDGEIVGAAAPELGAENKGRAMLEKLGWSSGTALGALDNKGILQPVVHVVKISKAGLG